MCNWKYSLRKSPMSVVVVGYDLYSTFVSVSRGEKCRWNERIYSVCCKLVDTNKIAHYLFGVLISIFL